MLPGLTSKETRDLILSVGTHSAKRRLSPVEVGQLFQKALYAGADAEDCAQVARFKDSSMISHFVRLTRLAPDLQYLVGWKRKDSPVPFIVAAEIARLNEDEQADAMEFVIANSMTRLEVIQMIQLRSRSGRRIRECGKEVVGMRTKVVRKHVFLGAVTDDGVREMLSKKKQSERDALLDRVLLDLVGKLPRTSASLGPGRFTIVTDDRGAALLRERPTPDFESAVNKALLHEVGQA